MSSKVRAAHKQVSVDVPEVLERCVDIKAPAVHVSDIGSGQFHFSDGQTCLIVLHKHKQMKMKIYCRFTKIYS